MASFAALADQLRTVRAELRGVREDADAAGESVRRTAAAAEAVEANRGGFTRLLADVDRLQTGVAGVRRGLEGVSSLGEVAVRTMGARVEEVERRVSETRERVSRHAEEVEEAGGRVRQAIEDTAQRSQQASEEGKAALGGLLSEVQIAGGSISDLLARFDVINEQTPAIFRPLIQQSEYMQELLPGLRSELDSLRDQVDSGALGIEEIVSRLGQLQTIHAQRILELLLAVKEGGRAAIRELEQALSEARRIPDSATGVLAGALEGLLDDALRNGQL